jgi:hypothetical protein
MTMTNEQLAADIERVMDFLCQIVSVESDATFDGLWQKTCYETSDDDDPIYRADVEKKQLIEFKKDAKLAADIIRQLTDIVRVQHEAGNALAGMTKSDGMTRNEAMALWDAAFALSTPLVKEV